MSCLRDFFRNLVDDKVIEIIQAFGWMPKILYVFVYRAIIDIEIQNAVLIKVRELTYHFNPKIWLWCDMLSLYVNIRPKDLLNTTEGDIDTEHGVVTIKRSSKKRGRVKTVTVRLIPEHIDEIKRLKQTFPGLSHTPFFSHTAFLDFIKRLK